MSVGRRPHAYLAALLVAGCAGAHPPLGTIQRIPGSTQEGHEIVPRDSAHVIRPIEGSTAPTAGVIAPLAGHAAPPAHEIVPLDTSVVPLDSTVWAGTSVDGPITLAFLIGGILRYTTPNGTYANGTWSQVANTVTFEMNGHFADYTGRIHRGRMSGTAHNRQGRDWEWAATRQ